MNKKTNIDYLRVSVTDRCNLRCLYCMPKEEIYIKEHKDIMSINDFEILIKGAVKAGLNKIKLTGGEPLIREDIIDLVKVIKSIEGVKEVTMTSNGFLLSKLAKDLKTAGLDRINISLDTLNLKKFKKITRLGNLKNVLCGIDSAIDTKLPIKINMIAMKNFNQNEIFDFITFSKNNKIQVRFIEIMPIGANNKYALNEYISINEIKNIIEKKYMLIKNNKIITNGPSINYNVKGGGTIGFIGAISSSFCKKCNRLRITSDGKIRLCLHKDIEFDILHLLRSKNKNEDLISKFIKKIIPLKPKKHSMSKDGWGNQKRRMFQIGG